MRIEHGGVCSCSRLASGCVYDYSAMVDDVRKRHPSSPLIAVGFSMGGNIVMKYFGVRPERQDFFSAAISVSQGYDLIV